MYRIHRKSYELSSFISYMNKMTAITNYHNYSENITILVDSWNTGLEKLPRHLVRRLTKPSSCCTIKTKLTTVRKALQIIGADLFGKTRHLTISRMYQYLGEDTKHGRLIQKNVVKSLDNRIIEKCSIESHQKITVDKCQLILSDFRDVDSDSIETNSKDLIFTDPPYNEDMFSHFTKI